MNNHPASVTDTEKDFDLDSWPVEDGSCLTLGKEDMVKGRGILIAKFLDLLTQCQSPEALELNEQCTIEDLYLMLGLELIAGKLLNTLQQ